MKLGRELLDDGDIMSREQEICTPGWKAGGGSPWLEENKKKAIGTCRGSSWPGF